jgi:hypothetical protein
MRTTRVILLLLIALMMIGTASAQYRIFGTETQATGEGDNMRKNTPNGPKWFVR